MKLIYKSLLLAQLLLLPGQADEIRDLTTKLCSRDGNEMFSAAGSLCELEARSIPRLIELLDHDQRVKPTTPPWTVAMYIGHGGISGCFMFLPYGLNEIQIRAGWVLEDITFQDFGFRGPSAYKEHTASERAASVALAKQWWSHVPAGSQRLDFLRLALLGSRNSQLNALGYMSRRERSGPCPGLTEDYYRRELHPIIRQMMHSPDAFVRESAAAIWLRVEQTGATPKLLAKAKLLDDSSPTYECSDEALLKDGKVFARSGDPLSAVTSEIPLSTNGLSEELVTLQTVPEALVTLKNGRIESFVATNERAHYGPPWFEPGDHEKIFKLINYKRGSTSVLTRPANIEWHPLVGCLSYPVLPGLAPPGSRTRPKTRLEAELLLSSQTKVRPDGEAPTNLDSFGWKATRVSLGSPIRVASQSFPESSQTFPDRGSANLTSPP